MSDVASLQPALDAVASACRPPESGGDLGDDLRPPLQSALESLAPGDRLAGLAREDGDLTPMSYSALPASAEKTALQAVLAREPGRALVVRRYPSMVCDAGARHSCATATRLRWCSSTGTLVSTVQTAPSRVSPTRPSPRWWYLLVLMMMVPSARSSRRWCPGWSCARGFGGGRACDREAFGVRRGLRAARGRARARTDGARRRARRFLEPRLRGCSVDLDFLSVPDLTFGAVKGNSAPVGPSAVSERAVRFHQALASLTWRSCCPRANLPRSINLTRQSSTACARSIRRARRRSGATRVRQRR